MAHDPVRRRLIYLAAKARITARTGKGANEFYRGKVPRTSDPQAASELGCKSFVDMTPEERAKMIAMYGEPSESLKSKVALRDSKVALRDSGAAPEIAPEKTPRRGIQWGKGKSVRSSQDYANAIPCGLSDEDLSELPSSPRIDPTSAEEIG